MKKILILQWNSFGNIANACKRNGYDVVEVMIDTHAHKDAQIMQEKRISEAISESKPDFVFSYNYFPYVSGICEEKDVIYVSFVYDSPYMDIYSHTVLNHVNYIFVFDYGVYKQFEEAGINTVHYLPLGVDMHTEYHSDKSVMNNDINYEADISFVGSLYSEPKHRLYDKFASLPPYEKGYLNALILAQKNIYGENILDNMLTDDLIMAMEKCYPTDPNPTTAMTPRQIYSQFVLSRKVTSIERREILELIGKINYENGCVDCTLDGLRRHLYTWEKDINIPGWVNKGNVDYYDNMPYIFGHSKINLNITLRSILTGIPLRALDIMAAGGFLISNYQAEFLEYFVPSEDMVIYEDYDDLLNKIEYYLSHDKERQEIALNGYRKICNEHNIDKRIIEIEKQISLF